MSEQRFALFFFLNDTATTEISPLSLHDDLPICLEPHRRQGRRRQPLSRGRRGCAIAAVRSEEHTSELQSRVDISYAGFCFKKFSGSHPGNNARAEAPCCPRGRGIPPS